MSPAIQFTILTLCALLCFLLYPVVLGCMIKKIVEKKDFAPEVFFLALFGGCIWFWITFVFSSLPQPH